MSSERLETVGFMMKLAWKSLVEKLREVIVVVQVKQDQGEKPARGAIYSLAENRFCTGRSADTVGNVLCRPIGWGFQQDFWRGGDASPLLKKNL